MYKPVSRFEVKMPCSPPATIPSPPASPSENLPPFYMIRIRFLSEASRPASLDQLIAAPQASVMSALAATHPRHCCNCSVSAVAATLLAASQWPIRAPSAPAAKASRANPSPCSHLFPTPLDAKRHSSPPGTSLGRNFSMPPERSYYRSRRKTDHVMSHRPLFLDSGPTSSRRRHSTSATIVAQLACTTRFAAVLQGLPNANSSSSP